MSTTIRNPWRMASQGCSWAAVACLATGIGLAIASLLSHLETLS